MIQLICPFCNRQLTRKNTFTLHSRTCKKNPNRVPSNNQYTKAKELGKKYIISDETREKFRITNTGRTHTELSRKKMSVSMKLSVLNNPESYRGKYNRGFIKEVLCTNGFTVLGSWEQAFVEFCLENDIEVVQPLENFSYVWEGNRTYFPDFYLPKSDSYIEVKGMQTDRDLAKWDSITKFHNKNLIVIKKEAIKLIKNKQLIESQLIDFKYN